MNQPRHVLGAGAVILYGCAPRHPTDADTPRQAELEKNEPEPPPTRERALTPTIRWDFDYARDEPPVVQRLAEEPRHTPPRAQAKEKDTATETVPETPSPIQKPGRSRGRGTWRAPQKIAPGVGTRSRTRLAELEKREVAQAQAAHARWPPSPDTTETIQELTRELRLCDVPRNVQKELQHVLPSVEEETIRTPRQPPAAGLMTRHQDTYYIPPPRAVGGARGTSAPVSTATLGLIQRQDPSLAAQLREDPASMMTQATKHKVYSTMRLIRAGMLGQLASLQQWEEAMRRQDEM